MRASERCFLMPTLNAARTLAGTLESLFQTAEPGRMPDIVVLDGGSTDATWPILESYAQRYRELKLHRLEGTHPGERVNRFIADARYRYAMVCHSDDYYATPKRLEALEEMAARGHWAAGTYAHYVESPVDAMARGAVPFRGTYAEMPLEPSALWCELHFWWCVTLTTMSMDMESLRNAGLFFDYESWRFGSDYAMNWRIAQQQKLSNIPVHTAILVHDRRRDGYSHDAQVQDESRRLRRMIGTESGLAEFLGAESFELLLSLRYERGVFGEGSPALAERYDALAVRLIELSVQDAVLQPMQLMARRLMSYIHHDLKAGGGAKVSR